ncbi:MAG: phosphomannomutase/phosphoglucomutase [Bryobacterales bacterium]|nr:phosphomannomutase/phosphoglucomutase [Bryobacterales bacterium]
MLKPTIFREYDIRGIAETELSDAGITALGRAIGTFARRRKGRTVNVGRDCRLSSSRLRDALVRGLVESGCAVTDLGVVPTPLVYYSSFKLHADGAVMITGSHNAPEYNGFKIMCGDSTIYGPQIQELRRMVEMSDFESGEGSAQSCDIVTPYVDEVAAQFSWERRVKVVLDAGNGVAGPVLERLLTRLNCEAVPMYFEMDGRFPNHHPDPTLPEALDPLIAAVKEHGAELGIGFDGDADRLGAVDNEGRVVWGDQLLLIYAREILGRKPGATFIGEVKCSQVMYDEIARLGGKAIMWRTGHSLIKAKMQETRAAMAGEMSGHMFFADRYYGFDDAIYAACRLLEIVSRSGRPLSAQLEGLPSRVVTPEIRVDCPDEQKFEVVRRVTESFRASHRVVDIDGVRVLFEDGWGLLRASNTGPVLVMRFEAANEEALNRYREEMERVLSRARAA